MESEDDNDEEEEMEVSSTPAFPMTSRPPIDIEQLAKQHFDNMIRAKLVTLEPTAEAMLPDAPVSSSEVAKTAKKKASSSVVATPASSAPTASTVSSTSSSSNGSNQTIYTCDQCDKTFTKKSSITRHKYEHSGKKLRKNNPLEFRIFKNFCLFFQTRVLTSAPTATRLSSTSTT